MDKNRFGTGIWVVGVLISVVLAACGPPSGATPSVEPGDAPPTLTEDLPTEVPPTETALPTDVPQVDPALSAPAALNVTNNLDRTICYLYLYNTSPDNMMGALYELRPGASVELVEGETGLYSLLVTDCDDQVVYWSNEVWLESGQTAELAIDEPAQTLRVVNSSADSICTLSMVSTPTDAIGVDLVNDEHPIPAGGERLFYVPWSGPSAVTATSCGKSYRLVTDDLYGEGTWTISD